MGDAGADLGVALGKGVAAGLEGAAVCSQAICARSQARGRHRTTRQLRHPGPSAQTRRRRHLSGGVARAHVLAVAAAVAAAAAAAAVAAVAVAAAATGQTGSSATLPRLACAARLLFQSSHPGDLRTIRAQHRSWSTSQAPGLMSECAKLAAMQLALLPHWAIQWLRASTAWSCARAVRNVARGIMESPPMFCMHLP